ncbi:MAG TPA: 4-phosphoerythronate dehydrogenase [Balneolaceae bacterium]|nr:4-phosphoerythronate dehydrogenase [Balneolaceae bacterium]
MVNVLADKNLVKIERFLPPEVNLSLYDPNEIQKIPNGTQALLIRTVTNINPETFPTLPDSLKFIATGSAGIDHVDLEYLHKNNIKFADAAGCNARSVAEYVAVALLLWAHERDLDVKNLTMGVIGAGHTGSAVQQILKKPGVQTVLYDPPRQERESSFRSATLEEVLASDILTFHTPLTDKGSYPTFHWLNEEKLKNRSFRLIINASRGGVIEEKALFEACRERKVEQYILDVWENEPDFNDEVARHAYIKTPHIAGYSIQAKQRASKMIVEALVNHFNISAHIPDVETPEPKKESSPSTFWSLPDALTYYHPIRDYETRFRMLIGRSSPDKIKGFNRIRTGHPLRNEFQYLSLPPILKELF